MTFEFHCHSSISTFSMVSDILLSVGLKLRLALEISFHILVKFFHNLILGTYFHVDYKDFFFIIASVPHFFIFSQKYLPIGYGLLA